MLIFKLPERYIIHQFNFPNYRDLEAAYMSSQPTALVDYISNHESYFAKVRRSNFCFTIMLWKVNIIMSQFL